MNFFIKIKSPTTIFKKHNVSKIAFASYIIFFLCNICFGDSAFHQKSHEMPKDSVVNLKLHTDNLIHSKNHNDDHDLSRTSMEASCTNHGTVNFSNFIHEYFVFNFEPIFNLKLKRISYFSNAFLDYLIIFDHLRPPIF